MDSQVFETQCLLNLACTLFHTQNNRGAIRSASYGLAGRHARLPDKIPLSVCLELALVERVGVVYGPACRRVQFIPSYYFIPLDEAVYQVLVLLGKWVNSVDLSDLAVSHINKVVAFCVDMINVDGNADAFANLEGELDKNKARLKKKRKRNIFIFQNGKFREGDWASTKEARWGYTLPDDIRQKESPTGGKGLHKGKRHVTSRNCQKRDIINISHINYNRTNNISAMEYIKHITSRDIIYIKYVYYHIDKFDFKIV
ncbi:hypothetical protein OOU_Y34scaffold00598g7 [Pyricularia oryzae Y34]|uniref:Uncharacterized protein n=1 Tax=Pyricularia oryzae (strain Y34) TaxID=1143189 RepID=A0AA97NVW1_PYRO3|nr:hypothetical protein OOU_Y34scaffold00598g7 [Pyricularia oryzae Y34]